MNLRFKLLIGCLLPLTWLGTSCDSGSSTGNRNLSPQNQIDSVSYLIGANVGYSVPDDELNMDMLSQGYFDATELDSIQIDDQAAAMLMQRFQQDMRMKQMQKMQEDAAENAQKAEEFLAENAKKEGIQVTESGLQYRVIEAGEGESPSTEDRVTAFYTGRLVDGTVFDSTEGGDARTFEVTKVIPGWTEALLMMKPGSKWQLFIPPDLAYGEMSREPIPPNSALIFDIEMVEVLEGPGESPQAPATR
jgi:FKBP-type peptidyl-prolyl cis-trans isomerase FklB